jgi:uncharacterized membrane protein YeaQ/YmgE (transglycosylase-associated protein family)
MHMLLHALFGLAVGIVAKFLMPGEHGGGLFVTALLGIAGGWVGGQVGRWLGWYKQGAPAGFGLSVVGAMILLLIYRMVL